ncbi:heparin-sulfate lyase HepC [uncultured Bacteroides sp.]|uniref:heparin-sulfate lyase HepC n=1 Tax=uncultured Bacteroides sp. TaxID=162156 RepID=UPI003429ADC4
MTFKNHFYICLFLSSMTIFGCTDNDTFIKDKDKEEEKPPVEEEEKPTPPDENTETTLFDIFNLDYPGLNTVKSYHEAGDDSAALKELLAYYRNRQNIKNPNVTSEPPSDVERGYADHAIHEYRFYVNDNYLEDKDLKVPYSLQDGNKAINWEFTPKGADNEYQKQLHRHNWMPLQGKAYQDSRDEKYMLSWKEVYTDWIAKHPLPKAAPDKFKWHQLQVSIRIMGQTESFEYFKHSPNFTSEWLTFFLAHFAEHADYLSKYKYAGENNILLSQAVALVFAGTLFPELKNAPHWQKTGCDIINEQTSKLFLNDGMTNDLSLHYHIGILDGLYDLKRLLLLNKVPDNLLSPNLNEVLLKAAKVVMHFTYPSYFTKGSRDCSPAFNDSWIKTRSVLNKNFKKYMEMFPENTEFEYMYTYGTSGTCPSTAIKTFPSSGFHVLRSGWNAQSTVLIHSNNVSSKLGDSSHNQLDNGTFELYRNGRNFFPDSGVCTYTAENNENIMELRRWFRQTKAHNTLVLSKSKEHESTGAENINKAAGNLLLSKETVGQQLIVTENQGYDHFKHRRAIFYIQQSQEFFVLVDEGFGTATGYAKLYFHLCDEKSVDNVVLDNQQLGAHTTFGDKNNLLIRTFGNKTATFKEFDGRISYNTDRIYKDRKAYAVVMQKPDKNPVRYITVLYPVQSDINHKIEAQFVDAEDENNVSVKVTVDGTVYNLNYRLDK